MMAELSNLPLVAPMLGDIDIGLGVLQLLLFFCSLWLIFLILIQRGKGGGLTAAFGGGGGDSAFGAKAGDAFTKITIVSALVWITLCMVTIAAYNPPEQAVNPYAQNDQAEGESPGLGAAPSAGNVEGEAGSAEGDSGSTEDSGTTEAEDAGGDSPAAAPEGGAEESSDQ